MLEKTVYILGAGASKAANLPTQAEILPLIFSIRPSIELGTSNSDDFLAIDIDDEVEKIREFYSIFNVYREELGDFIIVNFSSVDKINQYRVAIEHSRNLVETDAESVKQKEDFLFEAYGIAKTVNVTLEDLFTIFDNVASGREHFRLYSPERMGLIHNKLKLCIIYALVYSIATSCDDIPYNRFAQLLLDRRISTPQKKDTLAVITMNWDDILERSLFSLCNRYNFKLNKAKQRVYLDLCFYDYAIDPVNDHMPSTHIKAKGQKNIKVLKMHGSLGWLECPKCGRIYSDFSKEIAADEYKGIQCPSCAINNLAIGDNPILRSFIITPTFMKSFDNLNVKNIWHNAYIDISEAVNIVFIGYSFPDADFEMRCLLKKAVMSNVSITVVLNESSNPQKYIDSFISKGYSPRDSRYLVEKMKLPEERYKSFFGEDRVEFYYKGFKKYLNEVGGNSYEKTTDE